MCCFNFVLEYEFVKCLGANILFFIEMDGSGNSFEGAGFAGSSVAGDGIDLTNFLSLLTEEEQEKAYSSCMQLMSGGFVNNSPSDSVRVPSSVSISLHPIKKSIYPMVEPNWVATRDFEEPLFGLSVDKWVFVDNFTPSVRHKRQLARGIAKIRSIKLIIEKNKIQYWGDRTELCKGVAEDRDFLLSRLGWARGVIEANIRALGEARYEFQLMLPNINMHDQVCYDLLFSFSLFLSSRYFLWRSALCILECSLF